MHIELTLCLRACSVAVLVAGASFKSVATNVGCDPVRAAFVNPTPSPIARRPDYVNIKAPANATKLGSSQAAWRSVHAEGGIVSR